VLVWVVEEIQISVRLAVQDVSRILGVSIASANVVIPSWVFVHVVL
jgi:hypothetical protein